MPQDPAISLQNISKLYKRYHHPIERLKEALLPGKAKAEEFWALRDLILEIAPGDTVGIVGRNGSGKSTLLQIIAGTLQPTQGKVQVQGRVSALLELGSGFNPEFTGRQNAFFNGRILGLSQAEMAAKFDDIVQFAAIGDFIDQPVKTYSSGMFVRLAFAVAINVDPDILIIDEALSVGDEAFQRKCFARIYDLQERGVTVLFVSHSAASIVELCHQAVLIDRGEIITQGTPKVVVANYHKLIYAPEASYAALRATLQQQAAQASEWPASPDQPLPTTGITTEIVAADAHMSSAPAQYDPDLLPQHCIEYESRGAKIKNPNIKTLDGNLANILCRGERYVYSYDVYFSQAATQVNFGMLIKTISGVELGGMMSHTFGHCLEQVSVGSLIKVEFEFSCLLLPGTYFLNAGVSSQTNGEVIFLDRAIDVAMFKVQPEVGLQATGTIDFGVQPQIYQVSAIAQSQLK
ncbi:MAG: ABC transporter ATP-binding protein [Cyanobacteria bacterium P01_F01_bin.56]